MDRVNILDAVDIINNRVKPFAGTKRYLATGDLSGDRIDEGIVEVDYENKPSRADLLVKKGNILVARMQATNKVLLIDENSEDLIVSTGFLTLSPKDTFDEKYLAHYFRSSMFQRDKDKFCSGATQKAINNGSFGKLKVPKYSLGEQKSISNRLDHADSLRQKRKEQLALLDDYLKSVFLDMFGDPVENEKKWRFVPIENYAKVKIGPFGSLLHKEDYVKDGIPLVNPKHIVGNKIIPDMNCAISKNKHDELKQYHMKKGDVVLARRGEMGRCALVTEKEDSYLCGTGSMFIRPKENLNGLFLSFLMSTAQVKEMLENRAKGITMKNLNSSIIQKLMLPIPPIELQNIFVSIVDQVEQTKQKMRASLDEMDNHFNALIQRYFG